MISDEINYYIDNFNIKFACDNYLKLGKLEKEIRKYLKKELKEHIPTHFSSQDLRRLVMIIGKVHHQINKKIEFSSVTTKLNKNEKLTDEIFTKELTDMVKYIAVSRELQANYSLLNYSAIILDLLEQSRISSDELFNSEIIKLLKEFL